MNGVQAVLNQPLPELCSLNSPHGPIGPHEGSPHIVGCVVGSSIGAHRVVQGAPWAIELVRLGPQIKLRRDGQQQCVVGVPPERPPQHLLGVPGVPGGHGLSHLGPVCLGATTGHPEHEEEKQRGTAEHEAKHGA